MDIEIEKRKNDEMRRLKNAKVGVCVCVCISDVNDAVRLLVFGAETFIFGETKTSTSRDLTKRALVELMLTLGD